MNKNNHNGDNIYGKLTTYALMGAVFLGVTLPTIIESYKPKEVQPSVQADFWENLGLRGNSDEGLRLIIEDGK